MRVVAIVVGAAIAAAVACYSPQLADCQFQCGSGSACPQGYNCATGNVCRLPNASGNCPAGTTDALPANCPQPPTNGCSTPVDLLAGSDCATSCVGVANAVTSAAAASLCLAGGWRLAILDTMAKQMRAPAPMTIEDYWVGAGRVGATGSGGFTWQDGTPVGSGQWESGYPMSGAALNCVAMNGTSRGLQNIDCALQRHFLCDHP